MALYPPTWARAQIEEPYFSAPTESVALTSTIGIVKTPASSVTGRETTTARQLVVSAFSDVPIMIRIAQAESQMYPQAQNPHSTAVGLFQILKGTWYAYGCTGDRYDAQDNINCAKKIYKKEGTAPWNSSKANW